MKSKIPLQPKKGEDDAIKAIPEGNGWPMAA